MTFGFTRQARYFFDVVFGLGVLEALEEDGPPVLVPVGRFGLDCFVRVSEEKNQFEEVFLALHHFLESGGVLFGE